MKFKKFYLFAVLFLIVACLFGCARKDDNEIVAGRYNSELSKLLITEITQKEFDSANGINVVKDESSGDGRGRLYRIEFYLYNKESDELDLQEFNGLSRAGETKAEPCVHEDINGNSITSLGVQLNSDIVEVRIIYGGKYYYFFKEGPYDMYYEVPSFKGLELYCWQRDGKWECGLLAGTNRFKFVDEIVLLQDECPCPASEMKNILKTYTAEEIENLSIRIVSIPPKQEEIEGQGINKENEFDHIELYRELGLLPTDLAITYGDPDGALYSGIAPTAKADAGDEVIVRVNKVDDADVLVYVNGKRIETKPVECDGYYEYKFLMPGEDTAVKLDIVTAPDTVYLFYIERWLFELNADDVAEIDVERGYIGVEPGNETDIYMTEDRDEIARLVLAWKYITLEEIHDDSWQIEGGSFVKITFLLTNGDIYGLHIPNGIYTAGDRHFKMSDVPIIAEDSYTQHT